MLETLLSLVTLHKNISKITNVYNLTFLTFHHFVDRGFHRIVEEGCEN